MTLFLELSSCRCIWLITRFSERKKAVLITLNKHNFLYEAHLLMFAPPTSWTWLPFQTVQFGFVICGRHPPHAQNEANGCARRANERHLRENPNKLGAWPESGWRKRRQSVPEVPTRPMADLGLTSPHIWQPERPDICDSVICLLTHEDSDFTLQSVICVYSAFIIMRRSSSSPFISTIAFPSRIISCNDHIDFISSG